jgi:hypothetical protein
MCDTSSSVSHTQRVKALQTLAVRLRDTDSLRTPFTSGVALIDFFHRTERDSLLSNTTSSKSKKNAYLRELASHLDAMVKFATASHDTTVAPLRVVHATHLEHADEHVYSTF